MAFRTRIGLGLTVLCLAGPTVQAAAAEDSVTVPTSPELAGEALDAALETVSALSATELTPSTPVDAPATDALPAADVTEEPAEAVPEPEAPPAAPEAPTEAPVHVETPSETPSQTSSEPVAPATAPVATTEAPASTEAVSPEPAPTPVASAAQIQPVNVNVSIRIDSPGENGAVEQVNAALVAAGGSPAASSPAQYQPDPAQYQPAPTPPQPSAAPPPSPASAAPASGWNWTWTCGNSVTDVLPAGGSASYLPENWNWNWNWNCGDVGASTENNNSESSGQYHPGVTQYQPINFNISIRINSPGNDGAVTQTNVAVAVVTAPVITLPTLTLPVPTLRSPGSDDGAAAAPIAAALEQGESVLAIAAVELSVFVEGAETAEWIFRGLSAPFGVGDAAGRRAERDSVVVRPTRDLETRSATPGRAAPRYQTSTSALGLRAVAVVRAQESVRPDRAARTKSPWKPSRRPAPPMRAPVLSSGFAGASPGGTDGGGWPLLALLLVPFSLALVDSSRRMGRDAALPAAVEFFTRRERPG